MATTAVSTLGKYEFFRYGWTARIAWVKLYTDADVLVDQQAMTLEHTVGMGEMTMAAPVVFDVAAETTDVSYVTIGYTTGTPLDIVFYTKTLAELYDFPTEGTLTISSWEFTVGGTYLLPAGRDDLCDNGWTSLVTWVKCYNSSDVLLNSQSLTFSASTGTGIMSATAPIVFEIATGGAAYYMTFGYTDGTDVVLYKRLYATTYTFTTAGRLTIGTWTITL